MNLVNAAPYLIVGAIALGAGGYILHCEHVKKDRAQFIAKLEADAEAQRRDLAAKATREKKLKEDTDAQTAKNHAALKRTIDRLRNERARASSVPTAPTNASRPDLACFDRAEFIGAVGNLEAGVEGLVAEGAAATIDLDSAKAWAKDVWEIP